VPEHRAAERRALSATAAARSGSSRRHQDEGLSSEQKRTLALLGLPTFALALAITVVSTYLPVLARTIGSSTTVIGLIIASEGLVAMFVPLVVGSWSDRMHTRWGRRLPFLVAGIVPASIALALMGFAGSLPVIAVLVVVFFAAYFVAYEPYRAFYPDLLGDEVAGRSQSTQALWRGSGTLVAIVGGGLLFAAAKALPFLAAAVVSAACGAAFVVLMLRTGLLRRNMREAERPTSGSTRDVARAVLGLINDNPALRPLLIANALWELSLAALKTFVVLYVTRGLGHTTSFAAGVIGGAAVFILLGTIVSGRLADRVGAVRVMRVALWFYGAGLLVPFLLSRWPLVVALATPFVAFGGGALMALPFAVLMPLMPDKGHGAVVGYYSLSRGLGVMAGPVLAGGAISLGGGLLTSTGGYAAMWGVCALAVFASIPILRRVELGEGGP
jgi:Na+/melibiose symporter-like transporter